MLESSSDIHFEVGLLRKRLERERRIRLEAEALAERGTRQLFEREREQRLLHIIAVGANEAVTVEPALQLALDQLCLHTNWPVGHVYRVSEAHPPKLIPTNLWHLEHPEQFSAFRTEIESGVNQVGQGLPEIVFKKRRAVWVVDLAQDRALPVADCALAAGLRGAFAFPIVAHGDIAAIVQLLSRSPMEPDESVVSIADYVATQLGRVFERKLSEEELERVHKQLLETSRQAGMAEIATGVLHNVGNVLNSVSVSATLIAEEFRASKITNLTKISQLLSEHSADLGTFLTTDSKGKHLIGYLATFSEQLKREQERLLQEVDTLRKNIEHMKEIVAMQQSYAKVSGLLENLPAEELLEDALRINNAAFVRHHVQVVRRFEPVPAVSVDRHKALQILVNILSNAKYALDSVARESRCVVLGIAPQGGDKVKITVQDNGIGIPRESLTRIFQHGFTTKKDGHGFGLHSGANAAREMGGSLAVHSDGPGAGATFTLELPIGSRPAFRQRHNRTPSTSAPI